MPVVGDDGLEDDARQDGRPAAFEPVHVGTVIADEGVAGPGERRHRHLVAHGPAGQEQRRRLAEELGHAFLEPPGRRVLTELLVPDFGLCDRPTHPVGGQRVRV
jgi:hypothetical protein